MTDSYKNIYRSLYYNVDLFNKLISMFKKPSLYTKLDTISSEFEFHEDAVDKKIKNLSFDHFLMQKKEDVSYLNNSFIKVYYNSNLKLSCINDIIVIRSLQAFTGIVDVFVSYDCLKTYVKVAEFYNNVEIGPVIPISDDLSIENNEVNSVEDKGYHDFESYSDDLIPYIFNNKFYFAIVNGYYKKINNEVKSRYNTTLFESSDMINFNKYTFYDKKFHFLSSTENDLYAFISEQEDIALSFHDDKGDWPDERFRMCKLNSDMQLELLNIENNISYEKIAYYNNSISNFLTNRIEVFSRYKNYFYAMTSYEILESKDGVNFKSIISLGDPRTTKSKISEFFKITDDYFLVSRVFYVKAQDGYNEIYWDAISLTKDFINYENILEIKDETGADQIYFNTSLAYANTNFRMRRLQYINDTIFYCKKDGVYYSKDLGKNWGKYEIEDPTHVVLYNGSLLVPTSTSKGIYLVEM